MELLDRGLGYAGRCTNCTQSEHDQQRNDRLYRFLAVWASYYGLTTTHFVCALQPALLSGSMPAEMGTARFEALLSTSTANVIPITFPDSPNIGVPEEPSLVAASKTIRFL